MKARLPMWCARLGLVTLLLSAGANYGLAYPRPAANSAFTPDKGKFRILQQGNEVGTEEFDLQPSGNTWVMNDQTVIRVPGSAETRTSGQLRISADGSPQHYTWNSQGDKKASGTVEFDNGTAKTSINISGAKGPAQQDFKFSSPRLVVLDNNLYEQYAVLGGMYDWNAKGAQSFPVLIPQDATPGNIDVESLGTRNVEGAGLQVLRVHSTDLEIQLFFDAKLRLVRLEVPMAQVVVVRP
jgi:hypothetical protein